MNWLETAFDFFIYGFLFYSILLILVYGWIGFYAKGAIKSYIRKNSFTDYSLIATSPNAPTFSLIAPAYNEGATIVENVRSLLSLYYNQLEIIIVNDGSKDDSLQRLIEAYDLIKIDYFVEGNIETKPINAIYKSTNPVFKKLIIVDKVNGGKSDALNVGINIAANDYIVCIDVDCILEQDAILKLAKPFMDEAKAKVIACGGVIRLANNCTIVDTTIVNVAMNDMKGSLGVSLTDIAWVVTAYAIANVIVVPMTSWLSQQFGRRNYFATSIIIFTVASFLCGNASTMWEIILFRFIQGLGGGALLVTSQTIITESYPPEKRGLAQAIYGMGVIVGPTLGPPLGGYIVDNWSWPYIFYINIPIGIIATLLTLSYVKSPKYAEKSKLNQVDFIGIILLAVSVGSLQYVLEHGQQDDWFSNSTILILTITCFFGFILFIWRQLVFKYPIVNLKVLKDSNLAIGTILSFILGFGLYGSTFVIPIYTQSILGWTATDAGLLLIPSSLMTAFMMPIIATMLQKGVEPKYLVAGGFFIFFCYSFWSYNILTPDTGSEHFFWPLVVRGVGLGLLFVPITTLSLSSLKGQQIGEGAAFTGMMRQLGGSFGIAIITTFISRWTVGHRLNLVSHLDTTKYEVQTYIQQLKMSFISKGFAPNDALAKAYELLDLQVTKQATVLTYMDVFLFLGIIFLVCIPFILFFIKKGAGRVISAGH